MENRIKCPQCGAIHIDQISHNKYKCGYCGFIFNEEGEGFSDIKEQKLFFEKQKANRKQLDYKLRKISRSINIIYYIVMMVLTSLGFFSNHLVNILYRNIYKPVTFSSDPELYALLDDGAFISKDGEIHISDYATKRIYNGTIEIKDDGFGYARIGYHNIAHVQTKECECELRRNADSTKLYLCDLERHRVIAERSIVNGTHTPYLTFNSGEELFNFFMGRVYSDGTDTMTLEKTGFDEFSLLINGTIYYTLPGDYKPLKKEKKAQFKDVSLCSDKYGERRYIKYKDKIYNDNNGKD